MHSRKKPTATSPWWRIIGVERLMGDSCHMHSSGGSGIFIILHQESRLLSRVWFSLAPMSCLPNKSAQNYALQQQKINLRYIVYTHWQYWIIEVYADRDIFRVCSSGSHSEASLNIITVYITSYMMLYNVCFVYSCPVQLLGQFTKLGEKANKILLYNPKVILTVARWDRSNMGEGYV